MGSLVFRGSNEINMDAKGRMAIPARYRDMLTTECEGCLVATIDIQDPCLWIYPLPKWQEIESEIGALPTFNPETRRLQRLLIGHARDLELDTNGRVLIPPELRNYAGLDKKVVLLGQNHRLELWSQERWSSRCDTWLSEAQSGAPVPPEMQTLSL